MALYCIQQLADGCVIIDVETGNVIRIDDEPQVGLSLEEAVDVVALLYRIESHKPARLN